MKLLENYITLADKVLESGSPITEACLARTGFFPWQPSLADSGNILFPPGPLSCPQAVGTEITPQEGGELSWTTLLFIILWYIF